MERIRDSRSLALTTREMREIAREIKRMGFNRNLTPAQFKLLDPRGTHVITPEFMHDRAEGQLVEPHVRCYAHVKLIGQQKAIEKFMDVPIKFLRGKVDEAEMTSAGIERNAITTNEETEMGK